MEIVVIGMAVLIGDIKLKLGVFYMKLRKIFLFTLFFFFTLNSIFAAKIYEDRIKGYSGASGANFVGTNKDYSFDTLCEFRENSLREENNFGGIRKKLTEEEFFLVESALGEYSVKKGEIYEVIVVLSRKANKVLYVEVEIANAKKGGYYYVALESIRG